MTDAYSSLKVLHHPERIAALQLGECPPPVHVQLILSDLCNQNCSFCAYRMDGYTSNALFGVDGNNNPNRMIPWEKAQEIIHDCAEMGVKAVQFTGGGEPSLHPNLAEAMRLTKRLGMAFSLVTNGTWTDPDLTKAAMGATWVRVSIDAGRAETYARVRRTSETSWGKAWNTVGFLAGKGPVVGVGFVVTPDNYREIPWFLRRAAESGAANARISAMFSQNGAEPYRALYNEITRLIRVERGIVERNDFRVYDMFGDRFDDLEHASPDYPKCGYQHFTTYIGGDQNVYRCCNTAYNPLGLVGSVKDMRFKDLWESEARQTAYREFSAPFCDRCQYNRINETLQGVMAPETGHEAFV